MSITVYRDRKNPGTSKPMRYNRARGEVFMYLTHTHVACIISLYITYYYITYKYIICFIKLEFVYILYGKFINCSPTDGRTYVIPHDTILLTVCWTWRALGLLPHKERDVWVAILRWMLRPGSPTRGGRQGSDSSSSDRLFSLLLHWTPPHRTKSLGDGVSLSSGW